MMNFWVETNIYFSKVVQIVHLLQFDNDPQFEQR